MVIFITALILKVKLCLFHTFTLCCSLQCEAHRAGAVICILHQARWATTASAAVLQDLVSWTLRSRAGGKGSCDVQRSSCCKRKDGPILRGGKGKVEQKVNLKKTHTWQMWVSVLVH